MARPEKGSGPGLVLLQEIFGINDYMMDMADHFAEEGYVAIVPDLFWRQEEGVNLGYSEEDFQKAFGLYQEFDVDQALKDIQDTITTARGLRFVKGKVGTIGYCLGGLLAYLSATRTDADVAVGYYAVGVQDYLKEAKKLSCPLTLAFCRRRPVLPGRGARGDLQGAGGQEGCLALSLRRPGSRLRHPGPRSLRQAVNHDGLFPVAGHAQERAWADL